MPKQIIMSTHKPLILAVDDTMKNLQLIANVLESHDYDTAIATNGTEALNYFETETADLILLDIMMPDMDGFTVCKKLKENPKTKSIPVIFLTAKTDQESIVEGFKYGGIDYITKPFNEAELIARVKTHTELKMAHDSLIKYSRKLKELNSSKDRFFSIIAHDLKNPLLGLISISETLRAADKSDVEQVTKLTNMLHDIVMNQYKLLENLLEWSSLQSKHRQINLDEVQLDDLLGGLISLYEPIAQNKNIELTYKSPCKKHVLVADEKMIETIIRNLLSNAIKFTHDGGKVEVEVIEKNDMALIKVKDNGIGMDQRAINKLFKLDINNSTKGTHNEKGTGLGLILCKELIDKNNGKIKIDSTVGAGSTFTVSIPLFREEKQKEIAQQHIENRPVLVVDDNDYITATLKINIEKAGYFADVAGNGIEALEWLEENIPSLIITDVNMPGMNGFELIEKIKSEESSKDIPILILTTEIHTKEKARKMGVNGFLIKPFSTHKLISAINSILKPEND
jgi:DNA-binding response OmpR family regulator